MNTHRNRSRTVLAVAALAALSLSLTACNSGEGTKDSGAASTDKAATDSAGSGADNTGSGSDSSKASGGTDAAAAGAKQTGTGTGKSTAGGTGTTGGTAAKQTPECKVGYLDYSLKRENPEQQGDHLLITAVNRSATACTVQKFPVVTPGEANGDAPLAKDDQQPAQPIVVRPGGTVYSAINVYQETKAEDDYFTSIRLSLVRNNSDDSSESVKLVTPGEVEYAGKRADGIEVLSWNTKRPYAG
jgi:predicted small secreted protein